MGSGRGNSIVSIWKQRGFPSRRAVSGTAGTARDSRGSPSYDQPSDHRPCCHVCRLSFDDRHRCSRRGASQHAIGKIAFEQNATVVFYSVLDDLLLITHGNTFRRKSGAINQLDLAREGSSMRSLLSVGQSVSPGVLRPQAWRGSCPERHHMSVPRTIEASQHPSGPLTRDR
jgi:hypothetical protein